VNQLCVGLHISAAATGNAGLCIAAVVKGCAWACKGSSLVFVRSVREIAVSPALLAFGDCGPRRASGESLCAGPLQFGAEESVLPWIDV
jgi:hypothetical protein